jgi:hypothetical protein
VRERVGATVGEEDGPDGWAPPVSHQQERGKRGAGSWAAAQEGDGARGRVAGPPGRKEEGEGGKKDFLFFIHIFQMNFFSSNIFLSKIFWFLKQSSHKRNAPACMQQKFSKLILNF